MSLVVLGATWVTLECAYNRYVAINSFLLSLLLAPPVGWSFAVAWYWLYVTVLCSWIQSLESLISECLLQPSGLVVVPGAYGVSKT